ITYSLLSMLCIFCFVFFFQAEDGIRDRNVTGVQTCALPIYPYLSQKELKAFCKKHDIFIESWSPLYRGGEILEETVIQELADKYGKTPAQVVLRWHLQQDSIIIPKSVTPSRIKENIDVF